MFPLCLPVMAWRGGRPASLTQRERVMALGKFSVFLSAEVLRVEPSNCVEEKMHLSKGKGGGWGWYFENFRSGTCHVSE